MSVGLDALVLEKKMVVEVFDLLFHVLSISKSETVWPNARTRVAYYTQKRGKKTDRERDRETNRRKEKERATCK